MRKPSGWSRGITQSFFVLLTVTYFFLAPSDTQTTFARGDLMVSLSSGDVQWRRSDGTQVRTLSAGISGQAKGMAFDAAGNLYVTHWFSTDLSEGNTVARYNSAGVFQGTFGSGFSDNPSSIVFDAGGNAYVGQADSSTDVLKFDASGNLLRALTWLLKAAAQTGLTLSTDAGSITRLPGPLHQAFRCTNRNAAA